MFYRKSSGFGFLRLSIMLVTIWFASSCDRVKHQIIHDDIEHDHIDRSTLTDEREQEVDTAVLEFPDGEGIAENELAPEFSLLDTQDKIRKLSDYRGQKLVIVFFHDLTCYWCQFQLLKLEKGYATIKAEGAELVGITANSSPFAKNIQKELEITFPVLLDPNLEVITAYNVVELSEQVDHIEGYQGARPATLIIDSDGRISWFKLGYRYAYRASSELIVSKLKSCN